MKVKLTFILLQKAIMVNNIWRIVFDHSHRLVSAHILYIHLDIVLPVAASVRSKANLSKYAGSDRDQEGIVSFPNFNFITTAIKSPCHKPTSCFDRNWNVGASLLIKLIINLYFTN